MTIYGKWLMGFSIVCLIGFFATLVATVIPVYVPFVFAIVGLACYIGLMEVESR